VCKLGQHVLMSAAADTYANHRFKNREE
jgi:hypothetical protein